MLSVPDQSAMHLGLCTDCAFVGLLVVLFGLIGMTACHTPLLTVWRVDSTTIHVHTSYMIS